jgi:hypothetical protein
VINFFRTLTGIAAVAALGAAVTVGTPEIASAQTQGAAAASQSALPKKNLKDQGEYDIYNEVSKDVLGKNFPKALTDLGTWTQKYPESEYKDERQYFYIQAYNGSNQPAKALDAAADLLNKDLKTSLDPSTILQVLYATAVSAAKITASDSTVTPTPQEVATGEKAARQLLEFAKEFFAPEKKQAGVSEADWNKGRSDVETVGKAALLSIAIFPGTQAMKQYAATKDAANCATAEAAYTKVLQENPENAQISYALAGALGCQQKTDPAKVQQAIYEYARAAALEPGKGGLDAAGRKQVDDYLKRVYTTVHGSDEGLDQLKQQALASPLPPSGFHIETYAEIATKKENEFKEKYPQLAMWVGIKSKLTEPNGEQYFESTLKNADVPKLKGTVIEGKPACRSKELLVAIPEPGQQGTLHAEITLKLDAPLTGKPEAGEIQFKGIPSAFTREPLMLTMDTEKAGIEGLQVSPCTAAPAARPGGAKKSVPKKK